jgi:ankyrin repeat protein
MNLSDFESLLREGTLEAAATFLEDWPEALAFRNAQGASLLAICVYHGRPDVARLLLDRGHQPDFHESVMLGLSHRARMAIEQGQDVNALAPDGFPALALAVFFEQDPILAQLLESGADVNQAAANGMRITALHAAAARKNYAAIRELLKRGADVNARQHADWTALHSAGQTGDGEMARILLEAGADPAMRTDKGETAYDLALAAGHSAILPLLQPPPAAPARPQ